MGFIIDYADISKSVMRELAPGALVADERGVAEARKTGAKIASEVRLIVQRTFLRIIGDRSSKWLIMKHGIRSQYYAPSNSIVVWVSNNALARPSLRPDKHEDGVDNIINLIAEGYEVGRLSNGHYKQVKGTWHYGGRSVYISSRPQRDPYVRVNHMSDGTTMVVPFTATLSKMLDEIANKIKGHNMPATITLDEEFALPAGASRVRTTLYAEPRQ